MKEDKKRDMAKLLGTTPEELDKLSKQEIHDRLLDYWFESMESVYDE